MTDNNEPNGCSTSSSNSDYEVISGDNNDIFGKPIQIVTVTKDRKFTLDVNALGSILLRSSIKDIPIVVVSIAGDFRKGKSFMLNHFLRYLQNSIDNDDWIADLNAPLKGFSWQGGCERDTTGILMWSEPFVVTTSENKKVAVVLMDTQGAFDSEYTVKDTATVFALSTMTSSIQVFNLMHNLQEDNLQILEIFLEYGRLAIESVHEKPFQNLVFLIRDWSYPYQFEFGFDGGSQFLKKKLELKDSMPEQLQSVRLNIRNCFKEISCFLMPYPGEKVATTEKFDGRLLDYDKKFLVHLKQFVPSLLKPDKLVPKEISGRPITGEQLLEYFRVYTKVFAGDTMPEPKTMLEATAEANNLTAVALMKDKYSTEMEQICGGNQPYINPDTLKSKHQDLMKECLEEFDAIPKLGGAKFSDSYRVRLEEELQQSFEHFELQNKNKNIFGLFGTPLILIMACFLCFISSRILEFIGIQTLSNLAVTIGTVDLAMFIAYIFARYSGNYPVYVSYVDQFAEYIGTLIFDQIQSALLAQTTNNLTGNLTGNRNATSFTNSTLTNTTRPVELHKRKFRKD